jgi:hypothetical protein
MRINIISAHRYAEYMTVPELKFLVKVPDTMPLSVAAMLPTGALWAMNTIQEAREHILKILEEQGDSGTNSTILLSPIFPNYLCFSRSGESSFGWNRGISVVGPSTFETLLERFTR